MNQNKKMLSLCTITLLLAACGGTGSSTTTGVQGPTTISGLVQQGNIAGAKVFLDINGNGVQEATEPVTPDPTGDDGKFTLALTGEQVTALNAAPAAKIVSVGGTDKTTGLDAGLLVSDIDAVTGVSATKNITPMTTLTAMTPDAQKGELKAVLGTLGLKDSSGRANDDVLIETTTPAVIALCKSVESALLNVKKSTSVAVAQAAATEIGKALSGKTKADLIDTDKLADTISEAARKAISEKKTQLGVDDAQVTAMAASIRTGCKGVADAVKSKTGGNLSTEDHTKTESDIMREAGEDIKHTVDTATTEVETHKNGHMTSHEMN